MSMGRICYWLIPHQEYVIKSFELYDTQLLSGVYVHLQGFIGCMYILLWVQREQFLLIGMREFFHLSDP
jgi:hypothetical protein